MKPYDPFHNSSIKVEDFTIGKEECKVDYQKCNGKLKPGTIYRFKVGGPLDIHNFNSEFIITTILHCVLLLLNEA